MNSYRKLGLAIEEELKKVKIIFALKNCPNIVQMHKVLGVCFNTKQHT